MKTRRCTARALALGAFTRLLLLDMVPGYASAANVSSWTRTDESYRLSVCARINSPYHGTYSVLLQSLSAVSSLGT